MIPVSTSLQIYSLLSQVFFYYSRYCGQNCVRIFHTSAIHACNTCRPFHPLWFDWLTFTLFNDATLTAWIIRLHRTGRRRTCVILCCPFLLHVSSSVNCFNQAHAFVWMYKPAVLCSQNLAATTNDFYMCIWFVCGSQNMIWSMCMWRH